MKKHLRYALALVASLAAGAAQAIQVVYINFDGVNNSTNMTVTGPGVEGILSTDLTDSNVLPLAWDTTYATGYQDADAESVLPSINNLNNEADSTDFLNYLLGQLGEDQVTADGIKIDGNFSQILVGTRYFSIKQGAAGAGQLGYTAYFRLTGWEPVLVNITGGTSHWTSYGDPVPLPGAVWLFGSALVGLVALNRRRLNVKKA